MSPCFYFNVYFNLTIFVHLSSSSAKVCTSPRAEQKWSWTKFRKLAMWEIIDGEKKKGRRDVNDCYILEQIPAFIQVFPFLRTRMWDRS